MEVCICRKLTPSIALAYCEHSIKLIRVESAQIQSLQKEQDNSEKLSQNLKAHNSRAIYFMGKRP